MKFPYAVKYNGVFYKPDTEIPEDKTPKKEEAPKEAPKKKGGK